MEATRAAANYVAALARQQMSPVEFTLPQANLASPETGVWDFFPRHPLQAFVAVLKAVTLLPHHLTIRLLSVLCDPAGSRAVVTDAFIRTGKCPLLARSSGAACPAHRQNLRQGMKFDLLLKQGRAVFQDVCIHGNQGASTSGWIETHKAFTDIYVNNGNGATWHVCRCRRANVMDGEKWLH